MKDIKKYNLWTTFLEDYKEYIKDFNDTFQELKSFIDVNKRKPMIESKNKIEDKLAHWISNQRTNYKKKEGSMKDEVRYNLWTKFVEEYKEYLRTDDEQWYDTFEKLKIFIDKYEKRPVSKSTNEIEKKLGIWFITQNRNYNRKINSMKDKIKYNLWTEFVEEYKEYFQTEDDNWYKRFDELKQFISTRNKKPSSHSKNIVEKSLGIWIDRQKKNYKNKTGGMKDKTKYDLWTIFLEEYKEYIQSDEENWYDNFDKVKSFIKENKKRPSSQSQNSIVKKLGSWIVTQQSNYNRKINVMKDEVRYNLWTQFLEDYKKYFNNDDTQSITTESTVEEEQIEEKEEEILIMKKPKKSMKLKTASVKKEESKENKRERVKSEISLLHKEYKTLKSENLNKKFKEQPELWITYHQISEENEASFPEEEIPRNRIIQELNKIKTKRPKNVVDMGCGKGQISQYYKDDKRFQFTNYDHISSNDTVISCDISKLPLEEDAVEICILSLAMWGSNCREYIMEAYRILESNGILYIVEPTKRWSEKDEAGNMIDGKEGSKLKSWLEENGFQIIENSIKKFCLFKCIKN